MNMKNHTMNPSLTISKLSNSSVFTIYHVYTRDVKHITTRNPIITRKPWNLSIPMKRPKARATICFTQWRRSNKSCFSISGFWVKRFFRVSCTFIFILEEFDLFFLVKRSSRGGVAMWGGFRAKLTQSDRENTSSSAMRRAPSYSRKIKNFESVRAPDKKLILKRIFNRYSKISLRNV
jgi:hypothetical protein